MESLLKIFTDSYLFCAVFGGTLFILMSIMSFIGFGHDADCDCDVHDGGIGEVSVLSIKGLIAFVTFYGLGDNLYGFSTLHKAHEHMSASAHFGWWKRSRNKCICACRRGCGYRGQPLFLFYVAKVENRFYDFVGRVCKGHQQVLVFLLFNQVFH